MTPLQTITLKVEQRLNDDWVQFLLDKIVSKHCSKSTRDGCDCTYCQRKNQLSITCGNFNELWREYSRRFHSNAEADVHYWTQNEKHYYKTFAVDAMRDLIKTEAKVELEELRHDVLYQ
jgi:hypothetical protein